MPALREREPKILVIFIFIKLFPYISLTLKPIRKLPYLNLSQAQDDKGNVLERIYFRIRQ